MLRVPTHLALLCASLLVGCGTAGGPPDAGPGPDANEAAAVVDAGSAVDAGNPDPVPDAGEPVDPIDLAPKRWPELTEVATHDVDAVLEAVLERDRVAGACDQVAAGVTDPAVRLRCGKSMFFDEAFGTVGIPYKLLKFLQKYYAGTFYGRGFSNLGFVADPAAADGMPIGLRPTTGKLGSLETRAFTCAACHFGRMDDGRYAVGWANMRLDYGRLIASLGAPLTLSNNLDDPAVHPEIRAALRNPVARVKEQAAYKLELAQTGIELAVSASGQGPTLTLEEQERFLRLRTGTLDFLTAPLVEDGVWTVSRIISLWNLPDAGQRAAAGMPHELLSWNGGVRTLLQFLHGFVAVGVADAAPWTDERLAPLEEYLRSLKTPPLLDAPGTGALRDGARLFVTKGCRGCHAGPAGEGARVFTFDEIGTDPAYGNIYDPDAENRPCCGFGDGPDGSDVVTRGVKAGRLTGLAWQQRYLHNGAIGSLEELFCLAPRDPATLEAQLSSGHRFTCDGLTDDEKRALLRYLRWL